MRPLFFQRRDGSDFSASLSEHALLPILSLMMILIPVLIGKAAFFNLTTADVDIPNLRPASELPDRQRAVLLKLNVAEVSQLLEVIDEESGVIVESVNYPATAHGFDLLGKKLQSLETRFPLADTLVVSVEPRSTYQRLISALALAPSGERRLRVVVIPSKGL